MPETPPTLCCTPGATAPVASLATSDPDAVRAAVREKYAAVAADGGCGTTRNVIDKVDFIGEGYRDTDGYLAEADLQLGCGVPTDLAEIAPGDTVLDLGSGAGVDAFVARRIVGEAGHVIGVDMTPEMVAKARANAAKVGYANVTFRLGEIEALPVEADSVDVVISNCVLNLVPDKAAAFAEMARVTRPGGHFCVSDVVVRGVLPAAVQRSAELWAGCVAGAIEEAAYLDALRTVGFVDVEVRAERRLDLTDEALTEFLTPGGVAAYRASEGGLFSVTVFGTKPLVQA